jgi:hypothetical protein
MWKYLLQYYYSVGLQQQMIRNGLTNFMYLVFNVFNDNDLEREKIIATRVLEKLSSILLLQIHTA